MRTSKYFIILLFISSACTRIYTTATSVQPIITAPSSIKEKKEFSLSANYQTYNGWDNYGENVRYEFERVMAFDFQSEYAVTNQFSIGSNYKFSTYKPFKSNYVAPYFNYYKNYTSDKKVDYGFDIKGGIGLSFSQNYVEVDQGFHDLFVIQTPQDLFIIFLHERFDLGYYKIDESFFRFFVQPSFSVQNDWFEFHTAVSFAYQNLFRYDPKLELVQQAFTEDNTALNPMVYYQQNKSFFLSEVYTGFGAGPDYCRLMFGIHIGFSSDKLQRNYGAFNLGIRSNLRFKKKEQDLINVNK